MTSRPPGPRSRRRPSVPEWRHRPASEELVRREGGRPVVVVGVDGSDSSRDALRWAARHSEQTGAALHPVTSWEVPMSYGYVMEYPQLDLAGDARRELDRTLDEVLGAQRPAHVTGHVVEGHAARVLVDLSASADLLVVGSRGHGVLAGVLLGSVSEYCVHHAACPVAVVRPPH